MIGYPQRELGISGSVSGAKYITTIEGYPDSPRTNPRACVDAQVAAVRAALDYALAHC